MSFYIHRNISILQRHVLVGQKLSWISTYHHKWELGKRDYCMERKAKWHLSNRQHPLDDCSACFCDLSLFICKIGGLALWKMCTRHLRMKAKSDFQHKLKMGLKTPLHCSAGSVVLVPMMPTHMDKKANQKSYAWGKVSSYFFLNKKASFIRSNILHAVNVSLDIFQKKTANC